LTNVTISDSMNAMNQTRRHHISLVDLMKRPDGWGNAQGKEVGALLEQSIQRNPSVDVFEVSFRGVERTDASFSRESVVEIVCRFRANKGIVVIDLDDDDLIENLELAADKKAQPLFLWQGDSWRLLGPAPSRGNVELLNHVMSVSETTASAAASALDLKLTNSSTKLKQLWEAGYLLRREEMAPSGGIEFIYHCIK